MRILHISDTHFGTEQTHVMDALIRFARASRPDMLLVSGDITQRAQPHEFQAAGRFIESLGIRQRLVIPGNHDIPLFDVATRLFQPYLRFEIEFGELTPIYESENLLAITVLTTRRMRHKNGQVSSAQIDSVAGRLENARPGQLRVVVVHQPIAVLASRDAHDRLRGHAAASLRWANAGADLILGGHIHLPYVVPIHEQLGGLQRRLWAVQAGTAVSNRVRDGIPNSFNLIRWGLPLPERECSIQRWDYSSDAGEFFQVDDRSVETGWLGARSS